MFPKKVGYTETKQTNLEKIMAKTGNIAQIWEGTKIHQLERNHHFRHTLMLVLSEFPRQTPRDLPNFQGCHYAPGVSQNTGLVNTVFTKEFHVSFLRVDRYSKKVVFDC